MFNKHTTALYAAVISSILVASIFAISFVQQQALAQGNQTTGAAGGTIRAALTQLAAGQQLVVPQLVLAAVRLISYIGST